MAQAGGRKAWQDDAFPATPHIGLYAKEKNKEKRKVLGGKTKKRT